MYIIATNIHLFVLLELTANISFIMPQSLNHALGREQHTRYILCTMTPAIKRSGYRRQNVTLKKNRFTATPILSFNQSKI